MDMPASIKVLSNSKLPPEWLSQIGIAEEDAVVIQIRDRIIVGSRERVMAQLFELVDREWQDNDLTMEAFLERRPQIADDLLKDLYGLTPNDLAS